MKRDITKIVLDKINSKGPNKNFETNKTIHNHLDEIWFIDSADFSNYKTANIKGYRYIFIIIDNFSKHLLAIPPKNKNSQAITQEFSNILTTSKRSFVKIESDRGKERYKSRFQNLLKIKNMQHYSRFTDKCPSIAERVIRTIRNLLKKPVFEKGNANWISELQSVIKKNNYTIHHSIKMTLLRASTKGKWKKSLSKSPRQESKTKTYV